MKKLAYLSICCVLLLTVLLSLLGCTQQTVPTTTVPTTSSPAKTTVPAATTPTTAPTSPAPTKPAPTPAATVYKWRFQAYVQSGTDDYRTAVEDLAKRIQEATGGRIQVQHFTTGALVPNTEIVDALGKGAFEMGQGWGSYFSSAVPIGDFESGLPYAWRHYEEMYTVVYELGLFKLYQDAYAKQGVYYLNNYGTTEYGMLSKVPINSVDDLKKIKIRAIGTVGETLTNLGCSVTYVAAGELYTALSTGVVDACVYTGPGGYYDFKFCETAKYYIRPSFMNPSTANHLVSMKAWQALPADLQSILTICAKEAGNSYSWNRYWADNNKLSKMISEFGVKVNTLPESDVKKLIDAGKPVWDKIAAKDANCAKGIQILRDFLKTLGYM